LANLSGANLSGANLSEANLSGANLSEAVGVKLVGPLGSRGDFLYGVDHGDHIMYKAGCQWCNEADLLALVAEKHGDSKHGRDYRAAIEFIKVSLVKESETA
jgi:hypothetical protein